MSTMTKSREALSEQAIDRFWETIPPLWGMIRAHIRAELADKFDISVEQFHVLRYVRRGMGSVSELAAAKNISRPAISQAVDLLVQKGLLTRVHSSQDRRFVDLALTPAGKELLDTVFKSNRAWMRARMSRLSGPELSTVAEAMQTLNKMLEE